MREIVINNCFGGFGLSYAGVMKYAELAGIQVFGYADDWTDGYSMNAPVVRASSSSPSVIYWLTNDLGDVITRDDLNNRGEWFHDRDIPRDDPNLIKVVRMLKKKANGTCASLVIKKIPNDVNWQIEEYDGNEHIAEQHLAQLDE
jgi:hypothetical protein